MFDIKERITLVTGSTKGIGKAIAEAFVENKAKVIVHGRNRKEAEDICSSIGAYAFIDGELGTEEGCESVIRQTRDVGDIEILVNNAGIFGVQNFFETNDEDWMRYYQVNVMSIVRLCRALMPAMLKNDSGRIINLSSESAVKPLPQMIHYSMTKAAVVSVSRGLAELTKGSNVTVNSVLPGPTWTDGVESYFDGLANEEGRPAEELVNNYFDEHEPTSLIQRFVDVNEVASAVIFLATNSAVNGSAQRVEGGIIRSI